MDILLGASFESMVSSGVQRPVLCSMGNRIPIKWFVLLFLQTSAISNNTGCGEDIKMKKELK